MLAENNQGTQKQADLDAPWQKEYEENWLYVEVKTKRQTMNWYWLCQLDKWHSVLQTLGILGKTEIEE